MGEQKGGRVVFAANFVKEKAKEMGFDIVGITNTQPMSELAKLLKERQQAGLQSEFVSTVIDERLDPRYFFPEAKSVIMVGINYYYPTIKRNYLSGDLARMAWGFDYHRVLSERLEKLGQLLKKLEPSLKYQNFVDTGPLIERELARRAGLGWFGKNTALITPEFGSWVFLGGMLINKELAKDVPLDRDCGNCEECLKACPIGALEEPYRVNPQRCLSYLTQKKGYLTLEEREGLGNRLYGCDTCQEVCPINRQTAKKTTNNELKPQKHGLVSLKEILNLNKKQFQVLFGMTAIAWRGRNNLRRNAIIALGNSSKLEAVPMLVKMLQDPSPLIRRYAAWALGCHESKKGMIALQEAVEKEADPRAKEEMILALEEHRSNYKN